LKNVNEPPKRKRHKNLKKIIFFVGVLKVSDEKSRIWSQSQIRIPIRIH
jgi:hypothetical protein